MAIELLRGHVKEITPPDKRGKVDCKLGNYDIQIDGDLSGGIAKGDDILLACEQRKGAYHALAVRNIDKNKMRQIDPTNSILFLAAGIFVCTLGFVLDFQAEFSSIMVRSIDTAVGLIGLIAIVVTLRRLLIITRASAWVRHADI
jgi:hypothetical protein